ncbi:MAG TPA: UDP-N-acetylmuramate--L-alanine ligase [Patescibacteria group bacterium]|nr:UDP-N-acetylmuramate--L-alanine ligase [Patescibacteria group bacterium]
MFEGIHRVHIVGIGGIGVSALAKFLVSRGMKVTGSDLRLSEIAHELEAKGISLFSGHAAEHLSEGTDLVIYSPAVPEKNPERVEAVLRGLPQLSYPEALGEVTKEYETIAVCGTNGKSTSTAMLGSILAHAGQDPTVIVGTKVPGFSEGNLRLGKSHLLVVEACEYRAHFLHLHPSSVLVTNIEADHLDYFRDVDHIRETFQKFLGKVPETGKVFWNVSDGESKKLMVPKGVSYGWECPADYVGRNRYIEKGKQTFELWLGQQRLGTIELRIPGRFNVMNALAAASVALERGIVFETVREALTTFPGVWRRFEHVGLWKGADVFSDYGHHPTAVAQTIEAAREFFPGHRIIHCFQPHQHARTQSLFQEFMHALGTADVTIVPEIYAVAGRTEDEAVSSRELVQAVQKQHPGADVRFVRNLAEAESLLRNLVEPGDVLMIQGAGDVDEVARKMVGS